MATIFEQFDINGMAVKNRLIRSATWEGMCDADGHPTERLINCYRSLAAGGIGLIISGYTYVCQAGKQLPMKMGLIDDSGADKMRALVDAVHKEGGKLCIQLVHAGGQASSASAGCQPLAPSAVKVEQFPEEPQSLSKEEITDIVDAFGEAARRAKEYGFDAIQLHGAHGYLINQFLSPLTNCRDDEYGGSIENRCRFMLEVYGAVRRAVGNDYPVMIKLNGCDFLEGGLSSEDGLFAAKALDAAGIDAIEVSGGTAASGKESPVRTSIEVPDHEAYNLPLAKTINTTIGCPVFSVGGYRSYDVIENAINDGIAAVSLSRPLIWEPDLPKRWQSGGRDKAKCISCNGCFRPGLKGEGIRCVVADA